jgi:uncharacterized protein with von Willebrand factor type A (vWA) domain
MSPDSPYTREHRYAAAFIVVKDRGRLIRARRHPTRRRDLKTHIVSILDRSGSMASRANDVIGGYNAFLEEQKGLALPGDTWSLTLFDDEVTRLLDRVPLERVPKLTPETYRVRGSTALYDAIGQTLSPRADALEPDERGVVVIATDGEENASRAWTLDRVKELLDRCERSGAWTVVYLGVSVEHFTAEQHARQSTSVGVHGTVAAPSASMMYAQTSRRVADLKRSNVRATKNLYEDELPPAGPDTSKSSP